MKRMIKKEKYEPVTEDDILKWCDSKYININDIQHKNDGWFCQKEAP